MRTTSNGSAPRRPHSLDYREDLIHRLRNDPDYACGLLDACLDEGHGAFQVALRDVIEAFGGMTALSRKTSLNREALYRALSKRGNPRLESVEKVLGALGMRLAVATRPAARKARKAGAR